MTVVAGWVALAAMVVTIAGLVAVHVLPTGLSPFRYPVSQYHLTRYRPWIATSTISSGIAGIAAIFAVIGLLGDAGVVTAVLLAVYAVSRLLIPFLRMDPPGKPVTGVGRIHTVLAFGAFGPATAAAFVAGGALHDAGHAAAATWSTVFGVIAAVGAVGMLACAIAKRRGLFGFFERVIYVGNIAFVVLIAVLAVSS